MKLDDQLGYCTNVHAGTTCAEVVENLERYSVPIARRFTGGSAMGIGLWLSQQASEQIFADHLQRFADAVVNLNLIPFTFNAFPFGNFHQQNVKQSVYKPTWAEDSRRLYTQQIAEIQAASIPVDQSGSISTLPLGWPTDGGPGFQAACARQLLQCVRYLHELKHRTGRMICLCIEPEPGCLIDSADKLVDFFETYLLDGSTISEKIVRQHLGVCHDICHSAVMFESQSDALNKYESAGISIGKYQISSAIEINFDALDTDQRSYALSRLSEFAEDRYLHQTSIRHQDGRSVFVEDLPLALQKFGQEASGCWRVHFHVPIFATDLNGLGTTRDDIFECWQCLKQRPELVESAHFEIETYAWSVLPPDLQTNNLEDGILRELEFFRNYCLREIS